METHLEKKGKPVATSTNASAAQADTVQAGKTLRGTVVGTAMNDTAKVAVARYVKHPKYKKFIKQVKKYLVHDPDGIASVGDKVVIRETRPISKRKSFVIASNATLNK